MSEATISGTRKTRGRPATGAVSIHLRLEPDQMARLDAWASEQPDKPTRPEAVRRLIDKELKTGGGG